MFGEKGRYLYISDNNHIKVDGDISLSSASWKIEKLNEHIISQDIRVNYN